MREKENATEVISRHDRRKLVGKNQIHRDHHHRRCAGKEEEDLIVECSCQSCRSCTAGLIADCVAVCCCPCAVVDILALTFVKVPWMMGRKCLGLGKKNKKVGGVKENIGNSSGSGSSNKNESKIKVRGDGDYEEDMDVITREEEGTSGIVMFSDGFGEGDKNNYSARFEAEKVWLELYQFGHLGFGRVSFTGHG